MSTEGRRGTRSQLAGSNSTQGGVARRGKDQLKNPAMNGAIVAHWGRTLLWIVLVLMVAPAAYSQGPPDRDVPRNLRLSVVAQEADSTQYELRWNAPPGQQGQRTTGYDCQVDIDDDPVGFEGSGFIPEFECQTDSGTRSVRFWVPAVCGQPQTWVHTRVRVRGNFSDTGVGPWILGEPHVFTPDPCVVTAPTTLEIFLDSLGSGDTVPSDTTDLDLAVLGLRCALQPAGYRAANIPAEPTIQTQADLRTMSGTGVTWGSRRTLLLDGDVVGQVDMQHGGWLDSARYVRLGSGFTLPVRGLEPGPGYSVRFEVDAAGSVDEPNEENNSLTTACPEVS